MRNQRCRPGRTNEVLSGGADCLRRGCIHRRRATARLIQYFGAADSGRELFDVPWAGAYVQSGRARPEFLLKGGTRGPAIVPGKSADSLLFHAIKRDAELKMPPSGKPLSAADIETVRKWIDSGAPWSASAAPVAEATWWSFKKPVRPPVPAVKDSAWVKNPIDAFILARLEKEGLRPSPEADRRTLIRRASFDLLGLPPDPKEVDAFVKDDSPDAWEKLIDRYLASPRYGERWGRYWLDLVRYADTSGFETDHFFPNAWRYRDYVIDSFNKDKPYTTFVQEQIAADEIWPDNL